MTLNLDVIGKTIGSATSEYDWKDVVLYALGVGAGFDELEYVYEDRLKAIPSFAVTAVYDFMSEFVINTGVNLAGILHGEHEIIFHNPIPPTGGQINSEAQIVNIYDKGANKGALVIGQIDTYHSDGQKLFTNIATLFSRLDGGFGGENAPKETFEFPDREPDFEELAQTSPNQPLVYRLSGDTFALHVDPDFAKMSGFEKPIMHGLCTHGYACRAVIKHLFPGEPERMTRFRNRFSKTIYPGMPLKTQIWKMEEGSDRSGRALFRTLNVETEDVVIDRGIVEWMSQEEAEKRGKGGIRFDDQVAIVTGAGGGLGRVYALELAERGAKVVVNDLGGARDGTGDGSARPADEVVQEIVEAGGEAVANYDSVATLEGGENIVQTALEHFGKVDILINNAGILRDKSFAKMTPDLWDGVLDVHLQGAFNVTGPAFRAMRENGYGRVVMTTSAAGLFGNFGQTNYGSAKMGLIGIMNTLKIEGSKYNIKVNTVAPLAATRLTEDVMPPGFSDKLKPEFIAPLVLYLSAEQCPVTGRIYNAGMGYYGRVAVVSGPGAWVGDDDIPSPEAIAAQWSKIASLDGAQEYADANAFLMDALIPKPAGSSESKEEQAKEDGGASVQAVFGRMPEFFQADAAGGVDVVFQFNISGPDGGDWHVIVKDNTCTVEAGAHGKPTTTLKMADDDFLALIAGQLPAMQAFTTGKLKVEGDLMKSQLVEKLFKF
ncbi:MAG: SDR family NAD(P)-dependent oxidoreductase [Chloroflexi bacterium]|nr:SDR family NAD(P)-dependent oxidoreductase [Chloroflexota bacterium]